MMSAISGVAGKNLIGDVKDIINKMNHIQVHRGPDGQSIIEDNGFCFGHCLFNATPTQTDRNELIYNNEQTLLITYDGNLYNLKELKKLCSDNGHAFRYNSDAEVVLYLYQDMGIDFLHLLRGDFSFAVWDKIESKLFIVRDRFGIKPLFYSFVNNSLFFASELKALIKTGMVNKEIDYEAIYHFLFFTYFLYPQTPLKAVKSLLPGHYIEFNIESSDIKVQKYWDIPFSKEKPQDEKFLLDGFSQVLDESISMRMDTNRSMAVSLSGGLDSSFIAGQIAKTGYPLKTVTFGFKGLGEEYNEFKYAREVAESIGSTHYEYLLSSKDILNNHDKMIWHLETPTSGIILPYFLAKTAAKENIDITFRGDGGNSMFETETGKRFAILQKLFSVMNILPHPVRRKLCAKIDDFITHFSSYYNTHNNNLAYLLQVNSQYFKAVTGRTNIGLLFTESERKQLFLRPFWKERQHFRETSELVLDIMNQIMTRDLEEQLIFGELKRFSNQALMYITNVHSAFSTECRQPYWDHKVVEFSHQQLPLNFRVKNGQTKYILKTLSRSVLPDEIINRPQHGFYMPIHRWLRQDLKPIVDDVFSEETVKKRGLFSVDVMRKVYNQYYSADRKAVSWRKIWSLVALETWFRLFYDPSDIQAP